MRFVILSFVALVLLATPAAAENPDGPPGLLTIRADYSGLVGWDVETGRGAASTLTDLGDRAILVEAIVPVTWLLSLEGGVTFHESKETYLSGFDFVHSRYHVNFGARFHLPLTDRAKKTLQARDGQE